MWRTERKTKIGTQVAHVPRDSDSTFNIKRSKVNLQVAVDIFWRPLAQLVIIISVLIPSVVKIPSVKNKS